MTSGLMIILNIIGKLYNSIIQCQNDRSSDKEKEMDENTVDSLLTNK